MSGVMEPRMVRGHREQSVLLTQTELQDLRARQRTFEGAYWRTALAAFSTGLLILKVFTREFYKIGITFFVFGLAMLAIAYTFQNKWRLGHSHHSGNHGDLHCAFGLITQAMISTSTPFPVTPLPLCRIVHIIALKGENEAFFCATSGSCG
ncbi:predicted protein [Lichtheimia corymbifera JMRC:FSU:9682]|uniref:DUF202 domain-containing protein n=1 Tax=Lichtheimia corymbifera JMRC:FSU:9682 TaxID=1263082 RepID=A0A068RPC5_9FUNG|nr:predicted protein [Lichtheimia corymbifera JMRC:FSU:9682]